MRAGRAGRQSGVFTAEDAEGRGDGAGMNCPTSPRPHWWGGGAGNLQVLFSAALRVTSASSAVKIAQDAGATVNSSSIPCRMWGVPSGPGTKQTRR